MRPDMGSELLADAGKLHAAHDLVIGGDRSRLVVDPRHALDHGDFEPLAPQQRRGGGAHGSVADNRDVAVHCLAVSGGRRGGKRSAALVSSPPVSSAEGGLLSRAPSKQMPRDRYLAFAEWRLGVQRARDRRKSVKYFRLTTHHLIIWTVIMRGYYAGRPPSLNDCLRSVTCAAETARKIIRTAHAKGYLEFRQAPSDQRKKLIYPSPQCITEYERHVDTFLRLSQELAAIARRTAG
jgi:hypothetical protein